MLQGVTYECLCIVVESKVDVKDLDALGWHRCEEAVYGAGGLLGSLGK